MRVASSIALVWITLFIPATATGQADAEAEACVSTIPRSEFREVPVFLFATVYEERARPVLPSADLLSQSVAYRVRSILGAAEGDIPAADSLFKWQLADSRLDIVLSRDGRFTARSAFGTEGADTVQGSPMQVIHRAIQEAYDDAEWLPWPQSLKSDSVVFTLVLMRPRVVKGGRVIPIEARDPVAAFSLWVPWNTPATQIKQPTVKYPEKSRMRSAEGGVPVEFVIGTDGNIVPGSLKEAWPPSLQKPTGDLLDYYTAFKQAVFRGLPTGKYSPAVIGGCTVPQKIMQFFEFGFRR